MTNPFDNGPVAPERNPPINPQYFKPSVFFISAITLGSTTTVTTTLDMNYTIGQEVRLLIPPNYGARALNGQTGFVIAIPSLDQVTININSVNVDPFIPSPSLTTTRPQIIAIGDINSGVSNSSGRVLNGTFIPGSFINISPQ